MTSAAETELNSADAGKEAGDRKTMGAMLGTHGFTKDTLADNSLQS